jgi:endonuclease YncB( thermonuclease family)
MLKPASWTWPDSRYVGGPDADTLDFELTIDIGFGRRTVGVQRVRLSGVDCWKSTSDKGRQASEYVRGILAMPQNALVTVTTLKPYKYGGEYMARVTLPDGRDLSQMLLDVGLALPYDGRGPRPTEATTG